MKTMSNLLHHNHEDDADGNSSGNRKCKCRTRRIRTKNGCNCGGHRQKSMPDWVVQSKGQTMLVRYQYGKVQMNVAPMLRVSWSKVTSIGDKLLRVLRVLGVFQGSILRNTARTRSISGITLNTACT